MYLPLMGRSPTHRPGRWGVRCPVHTNRVGVQQSPIASPCASVGVLVGNALLLRAPSMGRSALCDGINAIHTWIPASILWQPRSLPF
jgi:hypothetical protein